MGGIGIVTRLYVLSCPRHLSTGSFEADLQAVAVPADPEGFPPGSGRHRRPVAYPCESASVSEPPPPRPGLPKALYAMPSESSLRHAFAEEVRGQAVITDIGPAATLGLCEL